MKVTTNEGNDGANFASMITILESKENFNSLNDNEWL